MYAQGCIDSVTTVKLVKRFPETQLGWTEAASKKNCGGIPHSCPSFVYHCLMNTWQNETVEVCAQQRVIVGMNSCKNKLTISDTSSTLCSFENVNIYELILCRKELCRI